MFVNPERNDSSVGRLIVSLGGGVLSILQAHRPIKDLITGKEPKIDPATGKTNNLHRQSGKIFKMSGLSDDECISGMGGYHHGEEDFG